MHDKIREIKYSLEECQAQIHNSTQWEQEQHTIMRSSFEDASDYIEMVETKVQLLKELILLTHEQVSHEHTSELQARQWNEFIAQFPDEA